MEALAFVEILGRDGRVIMRHPFIAFPCRVGRAYDNDVILDDPYVAAHHLEIEQASAGRCVVRDLESRNGTVLVRTRQAVIKAEIGPDETVRIGHTQLRIRPYAFPVPGELEARAVHWARHPASFVSLLVAAVVAVSGVYYQNHFEILEASRWLSWALLSAAVILVWSAAWAFAGRLVTGQWNYMAHAVVAGAAVVSFLAVDELVGAMAFAFGSSLVRDWDVLPIGGVFALQCFRHLRLLSRASRARLAGVALAVSLACFGGVTLISQLHNQEQVGNMEYLTDMRPPAWRLSGGLPAERFLAQAEALREQVDRERSEP